MSTELATVNAETAIVNEDHFDLFAAQKETGMEPADVQGNRGAYLPYIQLMGGSSDAVKTGDAQVGRFTLVSGKDAESKKDLGKTFQAILLAWRPKAFDMRLKPPLSFFNPTTEEFKLVRWIHENGGKKNGCQFGPEMLFWSPTEGYFTYFLGNITGRNEFIKFKLLLPDAQNRLSVVNVSAALIDDGKNKWHGPKATKSDISIGEPVRKDMIEQVKLFLAPNDSPQKPMPFGQQAQQADTSNQMGQR